MARVILRNLGGSVVLAVPKKILHLVQLDAGATVDLTVEGGRLIIAPRPRPRYTLSELLARTPPATFRTKGKARKWLRGGPVGRELL